MKHKTQNEKMVNDQQSSNIQNVPVAKIQTSFSGIFMFPVSFNAARQGSNGGNNTLRNHHPGKAPPGITPIPGAARGHPPENRAGPPNQTIREQISSPLLIQRSVFGESSKTKFQINNHRINIEKTINFYHILNFTIMKKQILFLAFLILAAFANVNKSYAQCADDALHPMAGKSYDYSVTIAGFTDVTYEWVVTDNPNILAAGTLVTGLAQGAATYTMTNGTTATPSIVWGPTFISNALNNTKQYYVVVRYKGHDVAANCDAVNIKAYRIRPVSTFQLDLANADNTGATVAATYSICTSDPVTATITENANPAIDPTIAYDYGTSDMYFKVTVRNFTGTWNLSVNRTALAALAGAGETFSMTWGTSVATATNVITDDNPVAIAEQTALVNDDEVIIIKVTYDHNTFEGLANKAVAIIANATDQTGSQDLSSTCTPEVDTVTQTLNARPTVVNATVATPSSFILP
jgi:hypothetical protein